ncbi:MAG: hypothetical protein DPW09_41315 [Anaerolineae bacterium]|nr:hypothetical protein [Anaerolineales bacterium]MCQ3979900.1 hypothetical protein [Anaerolineae bacterium]
MSTISRTDLHRLIDELPEPIIPEVAQFVEFIQFKLDRETKGPAYTPVALGGLWHGLTIKDEDIAAVRQVMSENFGQSAG